MNDEKMNFVTPISTETLDSAQISLALNVDIETTKQNHQILPSNPIQGQEFENVLVCENSINFTEEIVIKPETDLFSDVFEKNYNLILNNLKSASYVKIEEDFEQLSKDFPPDISKKIKEEPQTEVKNSIFQLQL